MNNVVVSITVPSVGGKKQYTIEIKEFDGRQAVYIDGNGVRIQMDSSFFYAMIDNYVRDTGAFRKQ